VIVVLIEESGDKVAAVKTVYEALLELLEEAHIEDFAIYAAPIEEFSKEG